MGITGSDCMLLPLAGIAMTMIDHLGKIWIDTVNGTPGTTAGTNGTAHNPVDNIEDASALAVASNLNTYFIRAGSVTLTSSQTHRIFEGNLSSTVNLGNQDCACSMFSSLRLTGTAGGSGSITVKSCILDSLAGASGTFFDSLILGPLAFRAGAFVDMYECRNFGEAINVNGGRIRWNGHNGYTLFKNMTNRGHVQQIYSEGGMAEFDETDTAGTLTFTGPSDWYREGGDRLSNGIVQALLINNLYSLIGDIQGRTFDAATDLLAAIRERGDAA